jgi:hypothetical protein
MHTKDVSMRGGNLKPQDADLQERRECDHQARTHGRPHHPPVFAPVLCDVVLAALAGVLGDAQREQLRVASDEVAQAVLAIALHGEVEGEGDDGP